MDLAVVIDIDIQTPQQPELDMVNSRFPVKLLAAHILGLGSLLSMPVQATLVTNTLSVDGSASAGNPATIVPLGPVSDSSYVSDYSNPSGADGSSAAASGWGNEYGTYLAAASGSGVFGSTSHFHRALTLTNDNGYLTDYTLSFFIYYGSLIADSYGATGAGTAGYDLSIKLNGVSTLFASAASIDSYGILTDSGTVLDGAIHTGTYYSWGGTNVTLDLGTLGLGESLTVDFDLKTTASGNFGMNGSCGSYEGSGSVTPQFAFIGECAGSAYATLGDPYDFVGNGQSNPTVTISGYPTFRTVPLPGTLALVGIGFAGLGLARRMRRG